MSQNLFRAKSGLHTKNKWVYELTMPMKWPGANGGGLQEATKHEDKHEDKDVGVGTTRDRLTGRSQHINKVAEEKKETANCSHEKQHHCMEETWPIRKEHAESCDEDHANGSRDGSKMGKLTLDKTQLEEGGEVEEEEEVFDHKVGEGLAVQVEGKPTVELFFWLKCIFKVRGL